MKMIRAINKFYKKRNFKFIRNRIFDLGALEYYAVLDNYCNIVSHSGFHIRAQSGLTVPACTAFLNYPGDSETNNRLLLLRSHSSHTCATDRRNRIRKSSVKATELRRKALSERNGTKPIQLLYILPFAKCCRSYVIRANLYFNYTT